jgi:hypothetical protein
MNLRKMKEKHVKDYLLTNWMTHDALWYREVASRFGMTEASSMNLRVCRSLGRIEFKRLLKGTDTNAPRDMAQLKELYEEANRILVPPFMETEVDFQRGDRILFRTQTCFAHKGMTEAGLIDEYECGIFERIKGWFDAMKVDCTLSPDLSRCLKFRGQECHVTIRLHFKS